MMKMRWMNRPGLLLGVLDGGASGGLERRVLRLLDSRVSWTRRWRVVAAAGCVVACAVLSAGVVMAGVRPFAFAQEAQILHAAGPLPAYEVVTIKPATGDATTTGMNLNGPAEIQIHNFNVKALLQMAYRVRLDSQIEGLSGWMTSQKFDIEARLSEEEVAAEQKMPFQQRTDRWALMMQRVLVERFQLKTSETMKDVAAYEVVVARGGSKLKQSESEDPAKPGSKRPMLQYRPGKIEAANESVTQLAEMLGRIPELTGRMVVNKTELAGLYDWTLTWTPANAEASANADAPGLFTAVVEQLGLKLVPGRAAAQVLVVERVERPTEN